MVSAQRLDLQSGFAHILDEAPLEVGFSYSATKDGVKCSGNSYDAAAMPNPLKISIYSGGSRIEISGVMNAREAQRLISEALPDRSNTDIIMVAVTAVFAIAFAGMMSFYFFNQEMNHEQISEGRGSGRIGIVTARGWA